MSEKNGTAQNEYMHESLQKDAVKYDLPSEEIIQALAQDNADLQAQLHALRWRPVSEPPEKEGQYWFMYGTTGYAYSGYYEPKYKKWQIFDPCGGYSDVDIKSPPSHWMPIPELLEATDNE